MNGEKINSLAIYSLPDNFEIAAFDYDIYINRQNRVDPSHILLTFSEEIFKGINIDEVLNQLKNYINFKYGEIFNLSSLESPQIYASKANDDTDFGTLEVLRSF